MNKKSTNANTSYYIEGIVKGFTIESGCPAKTSTMTIEPDTSFKVCHDGIERYLFVGDANQAVLYDVQAIKSFDCADFDATILLALKQARTKIRFILDKDCKKLEKIMVA